MRLGFEFKRTLTPKQTASMRAALDTLRLDRLFVVYPGDDRWPIAAKVEALPCKAVWTGLERL